MRIITQEMTDAGILTTFEDGTVKMLPHKISEDGRRFMDMDPNREIFQDGRADMLIGGVVIPICDSRIKT